MEGEIKKFLAYAARPLTEFKNYEALEMVEVIWNVAHDNHHAKEGYYRLVYETSRTKVNLSSEYFKDLLLRLVGDKEHEKVFDTVAKIEKTMQRRNGGRRSQGPQPFGNGRARVSQGGRPLCFYCNKPGHFRAQCNKRAADNRSGRTAKSNQTSISS